MVAVADERLTTSVAARIAQVSEQTVRQWATSGKLSSESTPLGRLFRREDVEALLAQRAAGLKRAA